MKEHLQEVSLSKRRLSTDSYKAQIDRTAYTLTTICEYCGEVSKEARISMTRDRTLKVGDCSRCSPPLKEGAFVRYGSPERAQGGDAVHADKHLTRGEVYRVAKVHRYHHASYFELEGQGRSSFITLLFVPKDFAKVS